MSIKSSLSKLFARDRQREDRLKQLREILEFGTEEQYVRLLIAWNVPREEREALVDEFRIQLRKKRGLP